MEYLAIGSVVTLRGLPKKAMVIGFQPQSREDPADKNDYIGLLFPEGFLDAESFLLFDKSDIVDVVFTGYENTESREFDEVLKRFTASETVSENVGTIQEPIE